MLERFAPDIICLQETWLVGEFAAPWVAGFTWYEHRRTKGKRGGIAILVRKGINILSHRWLSEPRLRLVFDSIIVLRILY